VTTFQLSSRQQSTSNYQQATPFRWFYYTNRKTSSDIGWSTTEYRSEWM